MTAAITPFAGDDAVTPAHWNVTFSTAVADASAAKAADASAPCSSLRWMNHIRD